MPPVYVREQGAVVRKRGERLIVTRENEEMLDLPLVHLDQLVLFGNVQLTAQAVAILLQREVDVVFLSRFGKFRGRLVHTGSRFAQLRHAQLKIMSDERANLAIAQQVVIGKLRNQQAMLQHSLADAPQTATGQLQRSLSLIRRMQGQAGSARAPDSLRGFEGSAGAAYWGAYRLLLARDLGFQGRKYFPPPDPVNALLSFGYSLLLKDVTAAVQLVGLDPYLGFFHTIDYGRPSLALDMMEEFRPVLVDPVILAMVNGGAVTEASFERTTNPKLPLRLTDAAIDHLIEQYERRLAARAGHPMAGGQTSLRRIIELQVRRLARVVLGEARQYQPFVFKQ